MEIDLIALANRSGEWLKGAGPESDIVISSRIRLARNLADHPFISKATELDRVEIEKSFRAQVELLKKSGELYYLDVNELDGLDRQFLVERQLISREHAESHGARGVAIDTGERISLMINEEDHLRIQVMHSGFDLDAAWERINAIDDLLESKVAYAFHSRLGYLTACPTNVGTGMRVSVMLHLPALVITRQIEKVFRSLHKISLAVRGLYGEGSQAMGDFYQISNQITLGQSELDLIKKVADVVPILINYERRARDFLMQESHESLHDRVSRAFGILSTAQTISSEETMHLLSSVRMGVELGLLPELPMPKVNELFIQTQPAHLQKISGGELDTADRNVARAKFLRRHLGSHDGSAGHEQN